MATDFLTYQCRYHCPRPITVDTDWIKIHIHQSALSRYHL